MSHTPGPWRIGNSHSWNVIGADGHLVASATFGGYQDDKKQRAEVDANARLISAAPDLLKACEAAYSILIQESQDPNRAAAVLREVIAKAKGETK